MEPQSKSFFSRLLPDSVDVNASVFGRGSVGMSYSKDGFDPYACANVGGNKSLCIDGNKDISIHQSDCKSFGPVAMCYENGGGSTRLCLEAEIPVPFPVKTTVSACWDLSQPPIGNQAGTINREPSPQVMGLHPILPQTSDQCSEPYKTHSYVSSSNQTSFSPGLSSYVPPSISQLQGPSRAFHYPPTTLDQHYYPIASPSTVTNGFHSSQYTSNYLSTTPSSTLWAVNGRHDEFNDSKFQSDLSAINSSMRGGRATSSELSSGIDRLQKYVTDAGGLGTRQGMTLQLEVNSAQQSYNMLIRQKEWDQRSCRQDIDRLLSNPNDRMLAFQLPSLEAKVRDLNGFFGPNDIDTQRLENDIRTIHKSNL